MNRFAVQLVLCALFIAHLSHSVDAVQSEAREAVPAAFNSFARVPAHDCTTLVEEFRKIEANTHSKPETTCTTVAARIMRMLQGLTGAHDVSRTLRAAVVGGAACAPGQNNGCTCTRASNDDCDTQFSGGFAPGHFYLGSIETDRAQATRSPSHAFVYFVYPNGNDVAIYQAFANQHSLRTTYSTVSKVRHAFKLMIEASTNHPAASQSSSSASTFLGRAKQFIKQQTPKLKHAFGMHVTGKPFTLLQRSTLNLFDAGVQTYVDDIERIVISVGYPGTLCTANNVAPAKFTTMCNLLGYKGVPNHVVATGAGAPGKCQ